MADQLCGQSYTGLCRARLTPLDDDCTPTTGGDAWVFDGFTAFTAEPEPDDAIDIEKVSLSNTRCLNFSVPPTDKWMNVTWTFCSFNTLAMAALTNGTVYTDVTPDEVGFGRPGASSSAQSLCDTDPPPKFSLELWPLRIGDDGFCVVTGGRYGYMVYPLLTNIQRGGIELQRDDSVEINITARGYNNPNYGTGGFSDFPDPTGLDPDDIEFIGAWPSGTALPAVPADCAPVPVP